jgi:beta-lactamase regulating signal transducer with metallopeptidase domain
MKTLLLLTVIGTMMITVGLLGLYVNTTYRIRQIEKELKSHKKDIKQNRTDIAICKERAEQKSDHIVITHEWDEASGIRYPSQEV